MTQAADVDAYFADLSGELAALATRLRSRLRERAPDLAETLAWGHPCYRGNERVFSIIAYDSRINLQLWNGARLARDHPRIEGTGRQLRHVKLRAPGDIDAELDAIIDAAAALDRTDPERVR